MLSISSESSKSHTLSQALKIQKEQTPILSLRTLQLGRKQETLGSGGRLGLESSPAPCYYLSPTFLESQVEDRSFSLPPEEITEGRLVPPFAHL